MDHLNDHLAASILTAGQAIKLRAKALSVLRISHGRVWVTVTDVGAYSRVIAGDHFLSRGDSLTLLPGQELVMEPFGRGEKTSAQFSWGPPGAVPANTQAAATANWRGGVLQPLLDLRHASGLGARAMGRLVLGLGHAAAAEVVRVANYVAIIFIAGYACDSGAGSTFDTACKDSAAPCRLYRRDKTAAWGGRRAVIISACPMLMFRRPQSHLPSRPAPASAWS